MPATAASQSVRSADGTRIAFDRVGSGPPLVLIEAAAHYRDFTSFAGLVPLLSREFTVFTYDRRGRGESTDTTPYEPDREVEDLDALIAEAGGPVHLYGYSSGALLALRAAADGLPVRGMALLEPPLQDDAAPPGGSDLTRELAELVGEGRNGDAVEHFHQSIGVPDEFVAEMRSTPAWAKMESAAHTLVYDCTISDTTTPALLRSVEAPTLVLDSMGSTDDLSGWAATVALRLPRGSHRSLAGEWHSVPDGVLGPALVEFFQERAATDAARSHDDYLAQAPEGHRTALERLHQAVISAAPDAEEVVRRGVPAFRYRGKPLVSIGAGQRHVALYVMYGGVLKAHASELEAYDTSNTVVRFDPDGPIPVDLVTKLVSARAAEIDGSAQN